MMRRPVKLGFYLSIALILAYVESIIPFSFGIPGIKLGLPNAVVLLLLYEEDSYLSVCRNALLVNVARVLIAGFLFSNLYTIVYSIAGAIFSFVLMGIAKKCNIFSIIGVSIIGGVSHNTAQILVAMKVVETYAVLYYMPFLIISGMITGAVLGYLVMELVPYINKSKSYMNIRS